MRIAVYCASSSRSPERYLADARSLGEEIAHKGHTLVYGGGRTGLMGALASAAMHAGARVHGVVDRRAIETGDHQQGLHELVCVNDARSRKMGLDERADAFIALPGGLGTLDELIETLSFRKQGLHSRPLVLVDTLGFFGALVAQLELAWEVGFDGPERDAFPLLTPDPREAVTLCEHHAIPV